MTEERLKEIKDSIDFQLKIGAALNVIDETVKEELELYNEVVRLREIINEVTKKIEFEWDNILKVPKYELHLHSVDGLVIKRILDIIKQNNLTLEQTTGIAND